MPSFIQVILSNFQNNYLSADSGAFTILLLAINNVIPSLLHYINLWVEGAF